MKAREFLPRSNSTKRSIALVAVSLVVFATAAQAQSGRRLPNRNEPPPNTAPPAQVESVEKPSSEKPAKMQIMVVRYQSDGAFSTFYSDLVQRGCLERLKADSSATVIAGRDMNRKEATDYAKNSTDTYVLWLEWDYDRFNGGRVEQGSFVQYYLYVPGTGKAKTSGRVYQGDYRPRVGGVGLPIPNGAASVEYALKECGKEIARRIIDSLGIGRPNRYSNT
jgi:hypothetical protein